jgi:putative nucleotidyltransferase with HDIG domain
MLGINTVKNLVLSSAVMGNFSVHNNIEGLDMEGFLQHSLCVGVAAKLLAQKRGIDPQMREEYFAAGLLHDIGKIPLNAVLNKEYTFALNRADLDRTSLSLAEERLLGLDHCSVGKGIVKAWKLEGAMGDAIIYHHNPSLYSGSHQDILYSVIAANHFACVEKIGFSGNRYPNEIEKSSWEALSVDQNFLYGIEDSVKDEIEKAKIFLKI